MIKPSKLYPNNPTGTLVAKKIDNFMNNVPDNVIILVKPTMNFKTPPDTLKYVREVETL